MRACWKHLEHIRLTHQKACSVTEHYYSSSPGDRFGCFIFQRGRAQIRVIATDGAGEEGAEGNGWEHCSVSVKYINTNDKVIDRMPTWDEMVTVKDLFWEEDETCAQYHPSKENYVNFHKRCLHIWKPTLEALPLPPPILVGPSASPKA